MARAAAHHHQSLQRQHFSTWKVFHAACAAQTAQLNTLWQRRARRTARQLQEQGLQRWKGFLQVQRGVQALVGRAVAHRAGVLLKASLALWGKYTRRAVVTAERAAALRTQKQRSRYIYLQNPRWRQTRWR
jgi:hypothetical protein